MRLPALLFLSVLAITRVVAASAEPTPTGLWATLYSPDVRTYAANLRAAGCPESTVGLLVSQEVNARFREREQKLQPSTASVQSLRNDFSPERREALVQLRLEKNDVLRAALGTVPQETARTDWSPEALARLTPRERDTVRMITDDYDAMIARVITESRGHFLDEDREKLRFLETERSNDLGKLLTVNEIFGFELTQTSYGRTVPRLKLFAPTLEQLRTYFAAGKKLGLDYEGRGRNATREMDEQKALNAQLAEAWSPEVYARYRRTTSAHYLQIFNLVRRLNLEPVIAEEIFASQKSVTEEGFATFESMRLASGQSSLASADANEPLVDRWMTPSSTPPTPGTARAAAYEKAMALAAEHCALVTARLGKEGFKEYFELNRNWLTSMQHGGYVRLEYSIK